jgi:hypothetical protein
MKRHQDVGCWRAEASRCVVGYTDRCQGSSFMKWFVIAVLVLILGSLGSALFYLVRDKGGTDRTVKALTLRIGLSLALFLLLMAGHYFGLLPRGRL